MKIKTEVKMFIIFAFLIIIEIICVCAQGDVPGKITGISSLPHKAIVQEFKPRIEAMKIILIKEVENMDRQIKLAQQLVQINAARARAIATQKTKETKQIIATAKEEAKYSSTEVKMCINKQEHESPKSAPSINCLMDYTGMTGVKMKLLKLQVMTGQLLTNCQQLHMDDNEKDIALFKKCLTERTDDTYRHITRMREEFDTVFGNVMRNSLQCVIEKSFDTFRSIGGVISSLKNCRNMNNFVIKKLP